MKNEESRPINLLLVDDYAANLVALKAILTRPEYNLLTASSGAEALQLAQRESFAVILLDIAMPGMDGFEVARRLKADERTRNIPILFLTAVATDPAQMYRGFDVGAVDYLIKPLESEVVRRRVAVFVELSRQREQIERQANRLRENERREYELRIAELRVASDRRYRKLVEGIDHAIGWTANATGRLTFVSRQAPRILGYSIGEFMDPGFWQSHVHPEDRDKFDAMFARASHETGDEDLFVNHRMVAADGRALWFHTAFSGTGDDAGRREVHGISVDVTEIKQAEQAQTLLADLSSVLSESLDYRTSLKRLAARVVPDLADWCLIDELTAPDRLNELVAVHFDPAQERALRGLERRGELDDSASAGVARVARSGEPESYHEVPDLRWMADAIGAPRDEPLRELGARSCVFVPLSARGQTLGVMTLVWSRPERRFGPADLALAEEIGRRAGTAMDNARLYEGAERARRDREDLLAIVSHDLRGPLGSVLASVAMFERTTDRELAQKCARTIARSAEHMEHLIDGLLDFGQLQAGSLTVERQAVDAAGLVRETEEILKPLAEQKKQSLEVDAREDLRVSCDRHRVLQVLSNLVGNAIKFTPAGGAISIRLTRVDGAALFAVADTGPGIPEADLPHIWERFWKTLRPREGGIGLGLSIAKGLVEAQGGRIWTESKVGVGTTFYFTLPLAGRPADSPSGVEST